MEQKEPDLEEKKERGTLPDEVIAADLPEEPADAVTEGTTEVHADFENPADAPAEHESGARAEEEMPAFSETHAGSQEEPETDVPAESASSAEPEPSVDTGSPEETAPSDDSVPPVDPETVDDPFGFAAEPGFEVKSEHGYCDICEKEVDFRIDGEFLRNHFICTECKSLPRQRAFLHALKMCRPDWRTACMHESSPGGPSSDFLFRHAKNYSISHYYPELESGEMGPEGAICEDLEKMSYPDNVFDVFITQDVMEHIFDISAAFNEVKRVLKPGGFFLFTVPYYKDLPKSFCRAKRLSDGSVRLYSRAVYHGNPVDEKGALVTWDYGRDFPELVSGMCGLHPVVLRIESRYHGLDGEMMEVFMMRKPRKKTDPSKLIPPAFVFPEPPSEDQPEWSPFVEILPPDEEKDREEEASDSAQEEPAPVEEDLPAESVEEPAPVQEDLPAESAEEPAPVQEDLPAESAEESAPVLDETPIPEADLAEESVSGSEVSEESSVAADVSPARNQE